MSVLRETLPFRQVDSKRAFIEVIGTLTVYFLSFWAAIQMQATLWAALPAMVLCGIAAVRLYVLQHDCMHRCFLKPKWLNDAIGIALSPLSLTPFYMGRYNHGLHHSHVGDLDRRDTFEISVMTLDEYRQSSLLKRIGYRIYRSPLTLLVIGPFLVYAVFHRVPKNTLKSGLWWDVLLHNVLLVAYFALVYSWAGTAGVLILLGAMYFGSSLGAIIPYVEHNFEDIHWGRKPDLDFETAALEGSAVLDFGDLFHFATANIGYHDLHHLNPSIPSYRLKQCHETLEAKGLLASRKISLREGLGCLRWKLWDEDNHRMVTFAAA
jgi:omega-6 fatty acid desaturase (delta-12 desaturase)